MKSKGYKMPKLVSSTETVRFTPLFTGSDSLSRVSWIKRVSPYKFGLFLLDAGLAIFSFVAGARITGLAHSLNDDWLQWAAVIVLSLIVVAFFFPYRLYNYHHVFLVKTHLVSLLRSFFWSGLTLGIILFLYSYPRFLEGGAAIPLIGLGAVTLLLLSRFYWDYLLHFLRSIGFGFVTIGIIGLLISEEPLLVQYPRGILLGFALAVILLLVSRAFLVNLVFSRWVRRYFRKQVAIVGSDEEAANIARHILRLNAPYWVTGFLSPSDSIGLRTPVHKERLGELKDLPRIVRKERISEIIVTDEQINKLTLIALLDYCTSEGLTVWFPPKLLPIIDMKLYIDSFCGLPMIRLCSQQASSLFNKVKHGLDALMTLPGVLMLAPLFLFIGGAIKMTSRGPVFYRAKAIGKNGKSFAMLKFRSMSTNSDSGIHKDYVTRLIKGEIRPEGSGGGTTKIMNDPRVTTVGKILRKWSLDELPQLLNVLRGEMSLVGPRPCLPYEYEIYEDWHKKRLSIRPGITGLWQVAGRSSVAFEDMVLLDLYYVYNRSVSMDLNIIYETVFAVIGKKGAY